MPGKTLSCKTLTPFSQVQIVIAVYQKSFSLIIHASPSINFNVPAILFFKHSLPQYPCPHCQPLQHPHPAHSCLCLTFSSKCSRACRQWWNTVPSCAVRHVVAVQMIIVQARRQVPACYHHLRHCSTEWWEQGKVESKVGKGWEGVVQGKGGQTGGRAGLGVVEEASIAYHPSWAWKPGKGSLDLHLQYCQHRSKEPHRDS